MIQEAYVSFEIAKLLKEKGFDIPCGYYYEDNQVIIRSLLPGIWNEEEDLVSAPTHQMVLAWLRKKEIYIDVFPHKIYERKKQFLYELACKKRERIIKQDVWSVPPSPRPEMI